MAYPNSDVNTGNLDAGTDKKQLARADLLDLATKFNLLRNHISAFWRALLAAADAPAVRDAIDAPSRGGSGASGEWDIDISGDAAGVTRNISTSGLATGGGVLTVDRTIAVPVATQAQAEAGTDNATAMTPLRVKQSAAANATGIGVGQSWQAVSRAAGTDYQNTLPRTITLCVTFLGRTGGLYVGPSMGAYVYVAGNTSSLSNVSNSRPMLTIPIPPGHYYKIIGTINNFTELR